MMGLIENKQHKQIYSLTLYLIVGAFFVVGLESMRIAYTDSLRYIFFVKNLFLAWMPLFLALPLLNESVNKRLVFTIPLLVSWLLFFPNAPYLITDLVHLRRFQEVPFWFDQILFLSLILNGLFVGLLSMYIVQNYLRSRMNDAWAWFVIVFCCFASGMGIYLGRFLRWNSWDIIQDPTKLLLDVFSLGLDPLANKVAWGMTILFGAFLLLVFVPTQSLLRVWTNAKQ